MQKTVIVNARVVSPGIDIEGASVTIAGGKIAKVSRSASPAKGDYVFDAKGQLLVPGFIDVHTHGALTYDFCDADPQAVFKLAEAKLAEGVTTVLPTTLTVSNAELKTAAANAKVIYHSSL